MMQLTAPRQRVARYFYSKNLRERSKVFENINESRDFYFNWVKGPWMYGNPEFPKKPKNSSLFVHSKKAQSENIPTRTEWVYKPSWAEYDPKTKMDRFERIEYESLNIPDLKQSEKEILDSVTSYEFASKQEKQRDTFYKMMNHVKKSMPYLKPIDLTKKSIIYRIVALTNQIRNMQEDRQELYALRRHETQRLESEKFKDLIEDMKVLGQMRLKALAELRMNRFEHYCGIMKCLKLEMVEPPRRTLPYPSHLKKIEERKEYVGRNAIDGRVRGEMSGHHTLNVIMGNTSNNDSEWMHKSNRLQTHTAAVIDMRIRTFYQIEQQMQAKAAQMKDLDQLTSDDKEIQWNRFKDRMEAKENGADAWKQVIRENEK